MLLVAVFPLAFLAGTATDALVRSGWDSPARRRLGRAVLGVGLLAAVPSLVSAAAAYRSAPERPVWALFVTSWAVVAAAVPVVAWLAVGGRGSAALRTGCWAVVLLAELVAPTATFPEVRTREAIYPRSAIVKFLADHVEPGGSRVMDRDTGAAVGERLAVLGIGSPEALAYRLETPRGFNPLDVRHYREFVGYVVDIDAPVRGLDPVAQPILPNFVITNRGLFDLLNVRYLVCPADYPVESGPWRRVADDPAPPLVPAIPPGPPPHLPPHVVYENLSVLPRAFVVPGAAAMPAGRQPAPLKSHHPAAPALLATHDPAPPG